MNLQLALYPSICPSLSSLHVFAPLLSSLRPPVCQINSQRPDNPLSSFKFYAALPPTTRTRPPGCSDLQWATIKTGFYWSSNCTVKTSTSFQSPTCCCKIKASMLLEEVRLDELSLRGGEWLWVDCALCWHRLSATRVGPWTQTERGGWGGYLNIDALEENMNDTLILH